MKRTSLVREAMNLIESLRAAQQLGRVRGTAQGLEVEIIRQSWNGPSQSYRIFPNVEVYTLGEHSYLRESSPCAP